MITENAPVFVAAGDGLAANFSIDFTSDLQHQLLTRGLWQGDAKDAKSLYVDNYENNFSISVYNGGQVTRVPAYSEGFMDLNGAGSLIATSSGAAVVDMKLHTEQKPAGFSARGNAPAADTYVPFSLGGSINLVAGNNVLEEAFCYSSQLDRIFAGTDTFLLIEINPQTKSVSSVKTWTKVPSCLATRPTDNKIIVGTQDGFYGLYDPDTGAEPTWQAHGGVARSAIWHVSEGRWYIAFSTDTINFVTVGVVLNTIAVTSLIYFEYSTYDNKIYCARVGVNFSLYSLTPTTAVVVIASVNGNNLSCIKFCPTNNSLYIGTDIAAGLYYQRNLVTSTTTPRATSFVGPHHRFCYSSNTNRLYGSATVAPSNANSYGFDCALNGNVGVVPFGSAQNILAAIYVPSADFVFSVHDTDFIYYYK